MMDMGLYEVYVLLGFGIGTMLTNFHMCEIMLLLNIKNSFKHGSEECKSKRAYVCSLSGPCELW